jgi:ADP-ribosyl-[dinitrogen reductase] hydrolase
MDPKSAVAKVRSARPGAIETSRQEEYVLACAPLPYDHTYLDRVLGCLIGGPVGDASW